MTTYSRAAVAAAANGAADLFVAAEMDADTRSLIDFMVNATLTLLDDPDATVEDVIEENWGEGDDADVIRDLFT